MENTILIRYYQSPCGELVLGSCEGKLCLCDWHSDNRMATIGKRVSQGLQAQFVEGESETTARAAAQLDQYFSGHRKEFDLPLLFVGTPFQKAVWQQLQTIPYGTTLSYAGLSRKLGNPKAVRAVAAANRANALSIIVPCHRIIGSDHTLTGYAGGLSAKKRLLELESVKLPVF